MPEPQEGRHGALLEGRDDGLGHVNWPIPRSASGTPASVASCSFSRIRLLRLLEQLRHEFCLEGRPEDSTGTQHAEDVRGEHRPINRCVLLRRRFVLDGHHRGLALVTVQEIHKLGDPTLRYATHSEEQW